MKKLFIILLVTLFLSGCAAEEGTDTGEIIDWEDKYVSIPEITKEYEIWFISDSHIIIPDEDESDEIKEYTAKRIPVFSNDAGVASSQVFSEFIKSANENKPDLILFGGDILDSPSEANIAFLKKELEILTVPYVFVFGNHDWTYPWEYMTENGIKEIFATQRGYRQTNKFYRQSKNLLQIENHKYFLVSIPSTPAKSSMRFFAGLAFIFCSRTSSI